MTLTVQQWDRVIQNGQFQGRPLWQWGFWEIAEELISNEGYLYLVDGVGLQSVLGSANAALGLRQMALVLRDYENGNVFRPVSGWTTLPDTILQALAVATNCHVQTDHRLLSARQNNRGIDLLFATSAGEVEVNAGKLILALPRRAVEMIE